MKICCLLLMVVAGLLSIEQSFAVVISPTVLEIDSQLGGRSQVVVTNNTTQVAPIEVSLRRLAFQSNGGFSAKEAVESQLIVFPPAAMIKAGQSQVFRLQWMGEESTEISESYFLRFSQPSLLLVDRPEKGNRSGIAVQIHYNAIIHVFSPSQAPNVELQVKDNGTAVVSNQGNRYTYLSLVRFIPMEESLNNEVSPLALNNSEGDHFLPPFSSIVLKPSQELEPGHYQGMLFRGEQ